MQKMQEPEDKGKRILESVPKKEFYFPEDFIVGLREKLGTPYGSTGKESDCVTYLMKEIKRIYRKVTGKGFDAASFVNGGKLLGIYLKNGGSPAILSANQMKEEKASAGNLIMSVQKTMDAKELKRHYEAGDCAIWQAEDNSIRIIGTYKEALKMLDGKGGALYLTKHYLAVGDDTEKKMTVLHATTAKGKAVEEKLGNYMDNAKESRFYIVVDLTVAYKELSGKGKNEFVASAP